MTDTQTTATAPTNVTHMVPPIGRRRIATPARWQAALARSIAQGLTVRYEASTGMAIVTSGTDATVCYVTDGVTCSCPAAANNDPICKHRAAYWHATGSLDPAPAEAVAA